MSSLKRLMTKTPEFMSVSSKGDLLSLPTLFFGQKPGCLREIRDDPIRSNRTQYGEKPFEDENPRPARFSCDTIHVGYSGGQETAYEHTMIH
jgi:hypothetical protein